MGECILIVDDDPGIRRYTRKYLETQTNYQVCGEAVDGLDAIEKARVLRPDLIILDMSMPRMNGLQAAQILNKMLSDVPIILFTMHAGTLSHSEMESAGIRAVVSKTEGLGELVKQVEALLESV